MKKIFLLLAISAVCIMAYFSLKPKVAQYGDEIDVQAYSSNDLLEGIDRPQKPKSLYYAVRHDKPRVSTLGFSITPPPGVNWYEKLENDSLFYLKLNKSHKQYSILTEAREVHLSQDFSTSEELAAYVKKEKERDILSSKFKNQDVTVKTAASPAENCVRYHQYYQDHAMKGLRTGHYVNVDIEGLFCLHPDSTRIGVDVSYLEKSLSDTKTKSYSREGEKFLASLTFQNISTK